MSRFSGPQGRGAGRRRRGQKCAEARERDLRTLPERRSTKNSRRGQPQGSSARAGDNT